MFSIKNDSCFFQIQSLHDDHAKLIFDFWKFQVNIYVGEKSIHYADDAPIRNEKERDKFLEALNILFYSSIVENVSLNKCKLLFKSTNKEIIASTSSRKKIDGESTFIKTYTPWLQKSPNVSPDL